MQKLIQWYRNMILENLFYLLIGAAVILLSLLFPQYNSKVILTLRTFCVIYACLMLLQFCRCLKPTRKGLYITFLGIPYRRIFWERITSATIIYQRQPVILLVLDMKSVHPDLRSHLPLVRLRYPFHIVTMHYNARNAALLEAYYNKTIN